MLYLNIIFFLKFLQQSNIMNLNFLKELVFAHSTSGQEDEVMNLLQTCWQQHNWQCSCLGRYALYAKSPHWHDHHPTILITAHADSPGYVLQSIIDKDAIAVKLGSPRFMDGKKTAKVIVKTASQYIEEILTCHNNSDSQTFTLSSHSDFITGDRICFAPHYYLMENELIKAPFLDNRVGCFVLAELSALLANIKHYNIILAVTGSEEFNGFGARVLAANIKADLAFCIDATYVDPLQKVFLKKGPVLTLTDASVLIGRGMLDFWRAFCSNHNVPLQTEVYNYSGTDAKAFPNAGCTMPVLPFLIPSLDNHSPEETIAIDDLQNLLKIVEFFCQDPDAYNALIKQGDCFAPTTHQKIQTKITK